MKRLVTFFIYSSATVLFITSIAKLVSIFGKAGILDQPDPILSIQTRTLLVAVAILEIGVCIFLFCSEKVFAKIASIAWLASCFLVYRLGLALVGSNECGCLGNLTDALHISPQTANDILKALVAYLLIGAYGLMIWQWRHRMKLSVNSYETR